MASTLQLEFSQAMADFKKMFPDIERGVIEAVLRSNGGAVDTTIDQLLAMSTDYQNEKLRNELDANVTTPQSAQLIDITDGGENAQADTVRKSSGATNTTLLNLSNVISASPNHHTGASPKQNLISKASNSATPIKSRRWNPPVLGVLPSGFLRIAGTQSEASRDFELPDEQFALMLQNEEFMNQLRWNQEFMNALEKEQCGKAKTEDDAAFKERLKNMGKMSRKKFLQMARVFTRQRNKKVTTAKQIDSLPLKEEPSDDEEHHHQHQSHQQQQHHGGQSGQHGHGGIGGYSQTRK